MRLFFTLLQYQNLREKESILPELRPYHYLNHEVMETVVISHSSYGLQVVGFLQDNSFADL